MSKPCPAIPMYWNGELFRSIQAAAFALNIPYPTMRYRYLQGYTCDADVCSKQKRGCTWDGIHYATIKEAAAALGISREGMLYRLRRGYKGNADVRAYGRGR